MPLYEYSCRSCAGRFEVLQRVGEGSGSVRCPACGAPDVERRLSTFATAVGDGRSNAGGDFAGCGRPQCGAGSGFT